MQASHFSLLSQLHFSIFWSPFWHQFATLCQQNAANKSQICESASSTYFSPFQWCDDVVSMFLAPAKQTLAHEQSCLPWRTWKFWLETIPSYPLKPRTACFCPSIQQAISSPLLSFWVYSYCNDPNKNHCQPQLQLHPTHDQYFTHQGKFFMLVVNVMLLRPIFKLQVVA